MAAKTGQVTMMTGTRTEIKQCPICDKIGSVETIEMLPGGGTLYLSTHEDGTKCQWSKYPDMEAARSAKTDQPSPEIKCPECNEFGVIVAERDESDRMKPDNWNYFVSHPAGQRCLVLPENRHVILKALGRYIDKNQTIEPTQIKHRRKQHIRCPRCPEIIDRDPDIPEIGNVTIRGSQLIVDHYFKKNGKEIHISHSMKTPEQKQKFRSLLGLKPEQTQLVETQSSKESVASTSKRGRGRPRKKLSSYDKLRQDLKDQRRANKDLYKQLFETNRKKMELAKHMQSMEKDIESLRRKQEAFWNRF
jgi:hypothetical protein